MSTTKVTDAMRNVTEVDAAKITTGTLPEARITSLAATKLTGTLADARFPATLPTASGANLTSLPAANLTGSVPSAALGNVDLSKLEYNQAILAFKIASANQLAKFSMVDQVIDEYQDTTGIDASASTNELAGGATNAKYFEGGTTVTPTTSSVGSVASTGTVDGDYTYYKWTTTQSDGTFTTDTAQDYEYLVVAGGASGGSVSPSHGGNGGGGGGAGGFKTATGFAVADTTITGITVGAGGVAVSTGQGNNGANSVFSTITSTGGGGGGMAANANLGGTPTDGSDGGSGGGGGAGETQIQDGGDGTEGQGYGGGSTLMTDQSGGGGGAYSVGGNAQSGAIGGDGGVGLNSSITGSAVMYAAGGGGSGWSGVGSVSTGAGVGGVGSASSSPTSASANTGSGGGGRARHGNSGAGGSGIVVIRRLTSIQSSGGNLTLQSAVATDAPATAPTTADLVILIEDAAGVATENTHIKAYVSRASSADFTNAVTLVDEGDWAGTSKRILVARNIDISGTNTGTSMRYKIETLIQSEGVRETRIHATSLAWA